MLSSFAMLCSRCSAGNEFRYVCSETRSVLRMIQLRNVPCVPSLVLWKLWMSRQPGEHSASARNTATRAKKKVVKMVTVVLVVFVVCWTPLQTIILYAKFVHAQHNSVGCSICLSQMVITIHTNFHSKHPLSFPLHISRFHIHIKL